MNIPMVDLKRQYLSLQAEIDAAVLQALGETRFILGPNVQAFDSEAADYLGVRHAISCASGTDALHLALLAAGIQPGDEIITSAFTFIATAEAIRYLGAVPVFIDIQAQDFNLDPQLLRAAITPRTRAILPVHLFGQPADMDEILALAKEHELLVIEDCAQSFGSRYRERMTGSMGCAGAFSFFPSKNLGCYGDGGMITTNDDAIAAQIKMLRNHGSSQQYHHDVIGYNSRLDELQAVILRIKLKHIDEYNRQRLRVAQRYNELLAGSSMQTPFIPADRDHVFHQYTLLCDDRDKLREAVLAQDIACAVYYPIPLHQQKAFADTQQPCPAGHRSDLKTLPVLPHLSRNDRRTGHHRVRGDPRRRMNPAHVMILAGEASGDAHAAEFVEVLRKQQPAIRITGMGSKAMTRAGVEVFFDSSIIAVVGLFEVLRHWGDIKRAMGIVRRRLEQTRPDLLVLVDYPEFNLKMARHAKSLGIPVLFYISPQVWAWRPKRIHKIGRLIDHMAVIFRFEKKYYEDAGIPVSFVGHPLIGKVHASRDQARHAAAPRHRYRCPRGRVVSRQPLQ